MAILDEENGRIVVRIVYDGPALSGKTTSLCALSGGLGRDLFTAGEAAGRTLFFDWMDYTGGRYEGMPIRCQVVSVPGQQRLNARRIRLLETADSIVFVADSGAAAFDETLLKLASLRQWLELQSPPRPGLVLQANKRDVSDAVPLPTIRARLSVNDVVGVTESVATTGSGIRETFVFAVRLALDRVRTLKMKNKLPKGRPDIDNGVDLKHALQALEANDPEADAPRVPVMPTFDPMREALEDALRSEFTGQEPPTKPMLPRPGYGDEPSDAPALPDPALPSGLIWPPVGGRMILHEALATEPNVRRLASGDWGSATTGMWRFRSAIDSSYSELELGRSALIKWARWHTSVSQHLSQRRCIALAQASRDSWRLWQVVHSEISLQTDLRQLLTGQDSATVARGLCEILAAFLESSHRLEALGIPCSLSSIGLVDNYPVFVGMMPPKAEHEDVALLDTDRVAAAFRPEIEAANQEPRFDVPTTVDGLLIQARQRGLEAPAETLAELVISH